MIAIRVTRVPLRPIRVNQCARRRRRPNFTFVLALSSGSFLNRRSRSNRGTTSRAVVFSRFDRPIEVQDVDPAPLGFKYVRAKIAAVVDCHSDPRVHRGEWAVPTPSSWATMVREPWSKSAMVTTVKKRDGSSSPGFPSAGSVVSTGPARKPVAG